MKIISNLVHVTPFLMRDSTAIAGAAIKKTLKERVLLPSDLCMETRKTLSMLVNCHASVSAEMALKLAKAFNTTPESWLNLQQQYSLWECEKEVDTSHVKTFIWPHNEKERRT